VARVVKVVAHVDDGELHARRVGEHYSLWLCGRLRNAAHATATARTDANRQRLAQARSAHTSTDTHTLCALQRGLVCVCVCVIVCVQSRRVTSTLSHPTKLCTTALHHPRDKNARTHTQHATKTAYCRGDDLRIDGGRGSAFLLCGRTRLSSLVSLYGQQEQQQRQRSRHCRGGGTGGGVGGARLLGPSKLTVMLPVSTPRPAARGWGWGE
jgi:hypothetical protein